MKIPNTSYGLYTIFFFLISTAASGQDSYSVSGTVTGEEGKNIAGATIHVKGAKAFTVSKNDGSFSLTVSKANDSLEVTGSGYEPAYISLKGAAGGHLKIVLKAKITGLDAVVLTVSKKSEKTFMQKVIEHKEQNYFPESAAAGGYSRYTKKELDLDNVNFNKGGQGIGGIVKNTYKAIDSSAKADKELPIYFSEVLAGKSGNMMSTNMPEQIIAKKTLGLQTDELTERFNKFYFNFNIYNDWLPVFDKTYISPLNSNAFKYYKFLEGDSSEENGIKYLQVRFIPLHEYENTFTGSLWINTSNYAVQYVNMHMSRTADLNFVNAVNYTEEFTPDSSFKQGTLTYIPSKFISEIRFESGTSLIGIPSKKEKKGVKFLIKNTTLLTYFNSADAAGTTFSTNKPIAVPNAPDTFWQSHRGEELSVHEKNIYLMTDSLKQNRTFKRDIKLISLAGTGYWDFGKSLRIGPYSSFISTNNIEGVRMRLWFWTMSGISSKLNFFGYGAYGTKDKGLKGMLGAKYIWNEQKWTKTSFSLGRDYDFVIDQDDELDRDNLLNSLLRKNIPYFRTYSKEMLLKHEQYISPNLSANAAFSYREISPVFNFSYKLLNPQTHLPVADALSGTLPAAELSVGFRYAKKERTKILNYEKLRLETFSPVYSFKYTTGMRSGESQFAYHRLYAGIEQRLRLPPRFMLYYKVEAGKFFGTAPYLLLNVPAGNEYLVSSKYLYNTMLPYEFAADTYAALHTRFYFNGLLLSHIPLIKKLGWRERVSFNAYAGGMSKANRAYNADAAVTVPSKVPFMEAAAGIENIFHVLSIEYYRRLTYPNAVAKKGGLYLGVTLSF